MTSLLTAITRSSGGEGLRKIKIKLTLNSYNQLYQHKFLSITLHIVSILRAIKRRGALVMVGFIVTLYNKLQIHTSPKPNLKRQQFFHPKGNRNAILVCYENLFVTARISFSTY